MQLDILASRIQQFSTQGFCVRYFAAQYFPPQICGHEGMIIMIIIKIIMKAWLSSILSRMS